MKVPCKLYFLFRSKSHIDIHKPIIIFNTSYITKNLITINFQDNPINKKNDNIISSSSKGFTKFSKNTYFRENIEKLHEYEFRFCFKKKNLELLIKLSKFDIIIIGTSLEDITNKMKESYSESIYNEVLHFPNVNKKQSGIIRNSDIKITTGNSLDPMKKSIKIILIPENIIKFQAKLIKHREELFIGQIQGEKSITKKVILNEKIKITENLIFYYLDTVFIVKAIFLNQHVEIYKMELNLESIDNKEINHKIEISSNANLSLSPYSKDNFLNQRFKMLLEKNNLDFSETKYNSHFPLISFDFKSKNFILTNSNHSLSNLNKFNLFVKLQECINDLEENFVNIIKYEEFQISEDLTFSLINSQVVEEKCNLKKCDSPSYCYLIKNCNHLLCERCFEKLNENKCPICSLSIIDFVHKNYY